MWLGRITKGYEISELTGEFSVQIEFARFINNKDTSSPRPSRGTARGVFATLYCCGEGQTEVVGEVARSKVTRRFIGVRRSREDKVTVIRANRASGTCSGCTRTPPCRCRRVC